MSFLTPVEGVQPFALHMDLMIQFANENPTSFDVISANGLRAAFVGTSKGNLYKVCALQLPAL